MDTQIRVRATAPALQVHATRCRTRIEQATGRLKQFKRVALRCEKTAENYASIVAFACPLIMINSVHAT